MQILPLENQPSSEKPIPVPQNDVAKERDGNRARREGATYPQQEERVPVRGPGNSNTGKDKKKAASNVTQTRMAFAFIIYGRLELSG